MVAAQKKKGKGKKQGGEISIFFIPLFTTFFVAFIQHS